MAKIVINAKVSKIYKDEASGIANGLRGQNIVGFVDVRPIRYKEKSCHIAGLKYDKSKRMMYMTTPEKGDGINLGVFITTYDVTLVDGKILAKEEIDNIYEISSVAEKFHIGGYDEVIKKGGDNPEVFPKKVKLKIIVGTARERLVLRNEKGFIFTCDFDAGEWYVLRPGTKLPTIYKMSEMDLAASHVFRERLPFPALDRKIYDSPGKLERGEFSMEKHVLENV